MLLNKRGMIKMSEENIIIQYSAYLQDISLRNADLFAEDNYYILNPALLLNYQEFKEYYILSLVGKSNYIDTISAKYQQQIIAGIT